MDYIWRIYRIQSLHTSNYKRAVTGNSASVGVDNFASWLRQRRMSHIYNFFASWLRDVNITVLYPVDLCLHVTKKLFLGNSLFHSTNVTRSLQKSRITFFIWLTSLCDTFTLQKIFFLLCAIWWINYKYTVSEICKSFIIHASCIKDG